MPDAEVKGDARDERLQGPMRLRHRDRHKVMKELNAEALEKCHETRAAYVECAKGDSRLQRPTALRSRSSRSRSRALRRKDVIARMDL